MKFSFSPSPRERQQLLKLIAAFIVLIPSYFMLLSPLRQHAANLGQQARDAKARVQTLEATTANETSLREQAQQLDQAVATLRSALPSEEELPTTIKLLSDLANETQVKIQTIFPMRDRDPSRPADLSDGAKTEAPVVYKEILIQIDALAGYHQLGSFLSLVESQPHPMRVSSLRISADPKETKRHRIKLVIRSFMAASMDSDA